MKRKSESQDSPDHKEKVGKPDVSGSSEKETLNKTKNGKFSKRNEPKRHADKPSEKPPNWREFKKEKKQLREKRKQAKDMYEVSIKAKRITEQLRKKTLQGGTKKRNELVNELRQLLGGPGNYQKYALAHDMARVIQYLLKFGDINIRREVSKELAPITVTLLQSKYGRYCVKRLLKYSDAGVRSDLVKAMYGHAVKLSSHTVSVPIFEYAYSTWANPLQKQHLVQEFFGDLYKQSKDDSVKHLSDVYKNCPEMKTAALGATKANLLRILNKQFLDSGLLQTVLFQYLTECPVDDRKEFVSQLAPHAVILSNSKDGARVVMQCIWHGTNKEKKIVTKALKEHVLELCKHEHGHNSIIALLDAVDDTVLLQKTILTPIVADLKNLASNEWGRKVLLWIAAPADPGHFHRQLIKELDTGRESSTSKKPAESRRKELHDYCTSDFLKAITQEPQFWLSTASLALLTVAMLKTGTGEDLETALGALLNVILDPEWIIKENGTEVMGVEHPGFHMSLKKIIVSEKQASKVLSSTFTKLLVNSISDNIVKKWIRSNRGAFTLVLVWENAEKETRDKLKEKLNKHKKLLKKQDTPGSTILNKKLE